MYTGFAPYDLLMLIFIFATFIVFPIIITIMFIKAGIYIIKHKQQIKKFDDPQYRLNNFLNETICLCSLLHSLDNNIISISDDNISVVCFSIHKKLKKKSSSKNIRNMILKSQIIKEHFSSFYEEVFNNKIFIHVQYFNQYPCKK